jgi:hypothetical protein
MAQKFTMARRLPVAPFGNNGNNGALAERIREADDRAKRHDDEVKREAQVEKDRQEARAFAQQKFAQQKIEWAARQEAAAEKAIGDHLQAEQKLNALAQMGPYKIAVASLNPIDPDFDSELEALDARYWAASGTPEGQKFAHGPGSIQDRFKVTQAKYRDAEETIGFDAVREFARYNAKDGSFHSINTIGLNQAVAKQKIADKRAMVPNGTVTVTPTGQVAIAEPKPVDPDAKAAKDRAEELRVKKEKRIDLSNQIAKNHSELTAMATRPENYTDIAAQHGWTGKEGHTAYVKARTADLVNQNQKLQDELKTLDTTAQPMPAQPTAQPATQSPPPPAPVTETPKPATPVTAPKSKPASETDEFLKKFMPTSSAEPTAPTVADHHAAATEALDSHMETVKADGGNVESSTEALNTALSAGGMLEPEIQQVHASIAQGVKPFIVPHAEEPRLTVEPEKSTTDA